MACMHALSRLRTVTLPAVTCRRATPPHAVAAMGGCVHASQYLRALDPPAAWGSLTCLAAAAGGQLDMLQWLRAQAPPCPLHVLLVQMPPGLEIAPHIHAWLKQHVAAGLAVDDV